MLTDSPPRKKNRTGFLESDRIKTLDLPQGGPLMEPLKLDYGLRRTRGPVTKVIFAVGEQSNKLRLVSTL